MKIFQISAMASLAALAQAAPAPAPSATAPAQATVVFSAAPASFTQTFPCDNTVFWINNPLGVNSICNNGVCTCEFFGVDGSDETVDPNQCAIVGPPQTQVSGICHV